MTLNVQGSNLSNCGQATEWLIAHGAGPVIVLQETAEGYDRRLGRRFMLSMPMKTISKAASASSRAMPFWSAKY